MSIIYNVILSSRSVRQYAFDEDYNKNRKKMAILRGIDKTLILGYKENYKKFVKITKND